MRNTENLTAYFTIASLRRSKMMQSLNKTEVSPLAPYTSVFVWKRARSLARIKVSAFGRFLKRKIAGDRGFKSHRARYRFRPRSGAGRVLPHFGYGTHRDPNRFRLESSGSLERKSSFPSWEMFQDYVLNMGLEIIKSAVALLQAVGILYKTAILRRALTSTS